MIDTGVIIAAIGFLFVIVLLYVTIMNRRCSRSDVQRTEEATRDLYARTDREDKISDHEKS